MGIIREIFALVRDFTVSLQGVAWILFVIFGNYAFDFLGLPYALGFNTLAVGLPALILFRRLERSEEMQARGEIQVTTDRQIKAIDSYVSLIHEQTEKQQRKRNLLQRIWNAF
jgi:hypothetical protein